MPNGGYWSILQSTFNACNVRLLDNLEDYIELLTNNVENVTSGEPVELTSLEHFQKQAIMANIHFDKSLKNLCHYNERQLQQIEFLKVKMETVSNSGGVSGAYDLDGGNLLLPILIGYHVPDIDNDGIMMPILDVEIKDDCDIVPSFGTMTDPMTGEKRAIELGAMTPFFRRYKNFGRFSGRVSRKFIGHMRDVKLAPSVFF